MEAGRLRQRVTIQDKTVTKDTYGGEVITWAEVATVWASVEPLTGREFIEGKAMQAEITTRVVIRYYPDGVRPEMRVVFGSIVYDIVSVIHIEERHREMHLMCRELPRA